MNMSKLPLRSRTTKASASTKKESSPSAAAARSSNAVPKLPFRLRMKSAARGRHVPAHDIGLSSRYFLNFGSADRAPLSQYDRTPCSRQDTTDADADAEVALFNRTPAQARSEERLLSPPSPPRCFSETPMDIEADEGDVRLPERISLPDLT